MPLYTFVNIETEEYRDIFFKMNDVKIYNGEDGSEVGMWRREYLVPQASIDTRINPESSHEFVEKTRYKKGSSSSLIEASKEASIRRAEIMGGRDPLKEKNVKKWEDSRGGKKHPSERIKIKDITIE